MIRPDHALRRSVRQPKTLDPAQFRRLFDALDDGVSRCELARRFGICETALRVLVTERNGSRALRGEG